MASDDQSGLHRAFREEDVLDFRYGDLLSSSAVGRVQVVQDSQDHTENFEISHLESRVLKAVKSGNKFQSKDGLVYVPVQGVKIDN